MTHSTLKSAKRELFDIQDEDDIVSSPLEHEVLKKPKTKKGNNRFGNKGTHKCFDCRKAKDACIFVDPDDVCDGCQKRKTPCGPKQLREQQRLEGDTPAPMQEPAPPSQELWDLSDPLLGNIFRMFGPGVTHEEVILKVLEELRDFKFDNNEMLEEALMNLFGMIHQVTPHVPDPDPEPHVPQYSPPQAPIVQFSQPLYQMLPMQQQQNVDPLTINPESLNVNQMFNSSHWPSPMAQTPSLPNPMAHPAESTYSFPLNTTPGLSHNSYPNLPGVNAGPPDNTSPSDGTYAQYGQQPVDNFSHWQQPSMDWIYTNPPR